MKEVDLRPGTREFVVTTEVTRGGTAYMGPEVRVNARDSEHAKEVVKQNGHKVNSYFEPKEVRKR